MQSGETEYQPIRLGYKFSQRVAKKFELQAGLDIGVAQMEVSVREEAEGRENGVQFFRYANSYSVSDHAFTVSLSFGLKRNLNDRNSIVVGVREYFTAESDVSEQDFRVAYNLGYQFNF
jgi:hypothetical protein